jgi:hypothetical protein
LQLNRRIVAAPRQITLSDAPGTGGPKRGLAKR